MFYTLRRILTKNGQREAACYTAVWMLSMYTTVLYFMYGVHTYDSLLCVNAKGVLILDGFFTRCVSRAPWNFLFIRNRSCIISIALYSDISTPRRDLVPDSISLQSSDRRPDTDFMQTAVYAWTCRCRRLRRTS